MRQEEVEAHAALIWSSPAMYLKRYRASTGQGVLHDQLHTLLMRARLSVSSCWFHGTQVLSVLYCYFLSKSANREVDMFTSGKVPIIDSPLRNL